MNRTAPSSGDAAIRRARRGEGPLLSNLAYRSKAYWGYDDAFMAACVDEISVSEQLIATGLVYVVEVGGRVLGFYSLVPLDERDVDVGHFFVEPDSVRKGYGKRLLAHATDVATELRFQTLLIQSDPDAEPFYRAMGAELIGTRPSASVPGRELPLLAIRLELSKGSGRLAVI